jgi:hypothetical protein
MAPRKTKTIKKLTDLTPDAQNPNRGTERGVYAVETSLERYGAGRSILVDARGRVIAGNKTLQAAADKGFGVEVVQTTGDTLIVVQRTDLDLDDPAGAARALSVADNRAGELGLDWDPVAMSAHMAAGMDVGAFFRENEISDVLAIPVEVEYKKLNLSHPPPAMTWVLIGIPTVRLGEINSDVERISGIKGVVCEISANDHED